MYGAGTIFHEKKRHKICVEWRDKTGKKCRQRFPETIQGQKDAEKLRNEINYKKYHGMLVNQTNATLGQWMVEWLTTFSKPKVEATTYKRYKQSLVQLNPIADVPLKMVTATTVQNLYNEYLNKYKPSTILKLHRLLQPAMKKAVALKILENNPMLEVEPPKRKKNKIEIFTVDELDRIQKVLDGIEVVPRVKKKAKDGKMRLCGPDPKYLKPYKLYFMALMLTGCRPAEMLALRFSDLKVERSAIYIHSSKKNLPGIVIGSPKTPAGEREVPVPKEFIQALLKTLPGAKNLEIDGYVFHTSSGRPYDYSKIGERWRDLEKATGISKSVYTFRHTYATRMLASGVPLLEVSRCLGHANPSHTVDLYGHGIPGFNKVINEKVAEVYGKFIGLPEQKLIGPEQKQKNRIQKA